MSKKTISVESLKTKINGYLLNTSDDMTRERETLGFFLSCLLMDTGNYKGFGYLTPENMKLSENGKTYGVDYSKPQENWFDGSDKTRVVYY